jgi:hypothetical protein
MVGDGGRSNEDDLPEQIKKLTLAIVELTNAVKQGWVPGASLRGAPPCREGCEMPACRAEGCESPACRCCCGTCGSTSGTGGP